ncbi:MAG: AMP-binding protein [Lachnospiraceae bacterium]|nr:AMP-binding protein [Lachnospiraceae bacterium]
MIWDLEKYGDKTALIEGDRMITYNELSAHTHELTAGLKNRSLAFILCSNTSECVTGYVAFLNAGIVPLMIDAAINTQTIRTMVESYKPLYIWLPAEAADEHKDYSHIRSMGGYSLLMSDTEEATELYEELALLISTSGSTGSPKLIRLSYDNIRSNTKAITEYLKIDENERAIASLPLNYVYGLSVLNTHLYAGGTLVLTKENCYSKKFWDCFERNGCTSFAGIPFMYEMMDKLGFTKKSVSGLKTMTQAGGKLSPQLHEKFAAYAAEKGISFVVMYGASEATARMGYLPADMAVAKKGSMGIAIPGGRFEIIDENNEVLEGAGEKGELIYYGDNVSLGYAECREDLKLGDVNHGRLQTGDMAYKDEDGYYYIYGRKKRFIKITGKRTNLSEVEMLIKDQFNIVDAACAGEDDSLDIYITDGTLKEGISDYIFGKLKINRHLFHVHVITEIPKNAAGKVQYAALKA